MKAWDIYLAILIAACGTAALMVDWVEAMGWVMAAWVLVVKCVEQRRSKP